MFGMNRCREARSLSVITHLDPADPRIRTFSILLKDDRRSLEIGFSESSLKSLRDAIDTTLAEAEKIA